MLLAIDIDNKFSNFAVFDGANMICDFQIGSGKNKSKDELRLAIKLLSEDKAIDLNDIEDIIISSVVPELLVSYQEISRKITKKDPIIISPGVKTGINIKCENPRDVGTDRIIRAVGAVNSYTGDIIIISAASITTIDFINSNKEFLGGLIMPGIDLFEKSLHHESARLPKVAISKRNNALGKNTKDSIKNGIYWAYKNSIIGSVNEIIDEIKIDLKDLKIITTGPFGSFIDSEIYDINYIPSLGFLGLQRVYQLNI